VHEVDELHRRRRDRRPIIVGVGDHRRDLVEWVALVPRQGQIDLRGIAGTCPNEGIGLVLRAEHGGAERRVFAVEARRRQQQPVGVLAAERIIGLPDLMDGGVGELVVVERRDRAVAVDLRFSRKQRRHRFGMRQRHRERVEPGILVEAPELGRRHLQRHRLPRDLHRRHRESRSVKSAMARTSG
jgi:hypothetical protein